MDLKKVLTFLIAKFIFGPIVNLRKEMLTYVGTGKKKPLKKYSLPRNSPALVQYTSPGPERTQGQPHTTYTNNIPQLKLFAYPRQERRK